MTAKRGRTRGMTVQEHREAVYAVEARARALFARQAGQAPANLEGFIEESFGLLVCCARRLDDAAAPWALVAQMKRLRDDLFALRSAGVLAALDCEGEREGPAPRELDGWERRRARIHALAQLDASVLEDLAGWRRRGRWRRSG